MCNSLKSFIRTVKDGGRGVSGERGVFLHRLPTGIPQEMHIPIEIERGTSFLCFDPGELGLRIGSDSRLELIPNTPAAALALRQIRIGTIRPASGASVSVRIALDHHEAAFIEIRDGGKARGGWQGTVG